MANHIVITKMQNGRVLVENSRNNKPFSLRPTLSPYSDISNQNVNLTNHNKEVIESFNPVNVEKVVRGDGTEVPIADQATLFNELNEYFFFDAVSGGSTFNYLGEFANYTDLSTTIPAGISGRFAYCIASEGTAWLPGSFGGSYYNKGWYYDNGTEWTDDKDEIANGLHELEQDIDNHIANLSNPHQTNSNNTPNNSTVSGSFVTDALNALLALVNPKLDSVVAGSGVNIDNTDPNNPIVSTTVVPSGVSQDYVRVTNSVAQAVNPTGGTAITYDTTDKNSNAILFTVGGGVVTVNQSGRYKVKAEISIESLSTQRADPKVKMLLNGVPVQDSLGRDVVGYGLYARNSGIIEDSSHGWDYVLDLTAGDQLQGCLLRNNIDLNGVSTIPDGTYLELMRMETSAGGGGGFASQTLNFSMLGQASSTTGLFTKAAATATNPSGLIATSSPFDQFVNGGVDPYSILANGTIERISIAFAAGAVGAGSVNPDVSIEIELYEINNQNETLIDTYVIPLDPLNIGVFNNLGGVNGYHQTSLDVSTPILAGDLIGIRFKNISGNASRINSLSRCVIGLGIVGN